MTRATPASTYDDDFFAWTQEQAAALRRLPSFAADVDIAHVAEEIEDLGKRDLREVGSFLARLLEHLVKIDGVPASRDVRHWRGEAINFQTSALEAFSPGMRQLLETDVLWRRAGRRIDAAIETGLPLKMPSVCPFAIDDLLAEDFDLDRALAILAAAQAGDTP